MDCPTQRFHYLVTQALNTAVKNNIRQFNQQASVGDWRVSLSIDFNSGIGAERCKLGADLVQNGANHTACQADIMNFLRTQTGYLSGAKIQVGLEDQGIFHGDSTVKHGLAGLVANLFLKLGPNKRGYQIA